MADVAFITGATRPQLLNRLHISLTQQNVNWQWLVQLDSEAIDWQPTSDDTGGWLSDDRVRIERNPKTLGSGATRNLALMRSTAPYVMCIDDDDLLYPNCVAELLRAAEQDPECFGVWGRTDLMHDADAPADPVAAEVFRSWPTAGHIPAGTIGEQFRNDDYFAVHVGATLWRRNHLIAVGGYSALPRSIDTHPFVCAEAMFPSRYVDVATYRYLIHPGQMTQTEYYHAVKTRVHAFTFERAAELRRLFEIRRP